MPGKAKNILAIGRWTSGLYTQRNPLSTPVLVQGQSVIERHDTLIDGLNMELSNRNTPERRPGFPAYCGQAANQPLGFASFRNIAGTVHLLVDTATKVQQFDKKQVVDVFTKTAADFAQTRFQTVADYVYMVDGTDLKKWDGTTVTTWGIAYPAAAPTATAGSGSLSPTVGYQYVFVFKNITSGHISSASPASTTTGSGTSQEYTIAGARSADAQVDKVDIYRTLDGGAVYYYLTTIDNPASGDWSYVDNNADSVLVQTLVAPIVHENDPPPAGANNICFHAGRMWVSKDNYVYFAGGPDITNGVPEEAFAPDNVFTFPGKVTGLLSISDGLIVFTVEDTFIIRGLTSDSFYSQTWMSNFGVVSQNCLAQDGDVWFIFTSRRQLFGISNSMDEVGFPVGDKLLDFDPAKTYLALHRSGADSGLFVSNGVDSIYRYSVVKDAWSPLAQPVGGVRAIASLLVDPDFSATDYNSDIDYIANDIVTSGGDIYQANDAAQTTAAGDDVVSWTPHYTRDSVAYNPVTNQILVAADASHTDALRLFDLESSAEVVVNATQTVQNQPTAFADPDGKFWVQRGATLFLPQYDRLNSSTLAIEDSAVWTGSSAIFPCPAFLWTTDDFIGTDGASGKYLFLREVKRVEGFRIYAAGGTVSVGHGDCTTLGSLTGKFLRAVPTADGHGDIWALSCQSNGTAEIASCTPNNFPGGAYTFVIDSITLGDSGDSSRAAIGFFYYKAGNCFIIVTGNGKFHTFDIATRTLSASSGPPTGFTASSGNSAHLLEECLPIAAINSTLSTGVLSDDSFLLIGSIGVKVNQVVRISAADFSILDTYDLPTYTLSGGTTLATALGSSTWTLTGAAYDDAKKLLLLAVGSSHDPVGVYLDQDHTTRTAIAPTDVGQTVWTVVSTTTLFTDHPNMDHYLLAGRPFDAGSILKRDAAVWNDEGEMYSAYVTVGSLVVSPLGDTAGVESISVERTTAGTAPTVSVLMNEISGTFTTLPNPVSEPPLLTASTTVTAKRHYLKAAATPMPQAAHHMQIKVAFPSEDAHSELLTVAVSPVEHK